MVEMRSSISTCYCLLALVSASLVSGHGSTQDQVERTGEYEVHSVKDNKAVNQGRSSQFAVCRQRGNCIGRVLVCPSYCLARVSSTARQSASVKHDHVDDYTDDYNYYYYYDYDYGSSNSRGQNGLRRGRNNNSPRGRGSGTPTGGFGSGSPTRGGFGSGTPSGGFGSGTPSGGFGSGTPSGGFGSSTPTGGFGSGTPAVGRGSGGTTVSPGRSGSSGAAGNGNGCKYDCVTSCRAFCA